VDENTTADLAGLERWARQLGIEHVRFKRKHPTMPSEIPRTELLAKYNFDRPQRPPGLTSREQLAWCQGDCSHPWSSLFIGCTGEISTCSFDPYLSNAYGSAADAFPTIWNGKRISQIRQSHGGRNLRLPAACLRCNRLPGYLERTSGPSAMG
jgi:radical SAM protein with 4Fe4S-binding SPASM domain